MFGLKSKNKINLMQKRYNLRAKCIGASGCSVDYGRRKNGKYQNGSKYSASGKIHWY